MRRPRLTRMTSSPYTVGVLVVGESLSPTYLSIVYEIWGKHREEHPVQKAELLLCGEHTPSEIHHAPVSVRVDHSLSALRRAAVVVIPGGCANQLMVPSGRLRQALVDAHDRGTCLVGLGSGAFPLAAAGLLDDRAATTEAELVWRLRIAHPSVKCLPFEPATHDGAVYCGAGFDGAANACLNVVEHEWGVLAAAGIRRELYADPRFHQRPHRPITTVKREIEASLRRLLQWVPRHLEEDLSVSALAARVDMQPQRFSLAFRQAVGTTPSRWVNDLRVDRAARLLTNSTMDVGEVAASCGFGSASALRYHMRRVLGASPSVYRHSRQLDETSGATAWAAPAWPPPTAAVALG